eukprot:TRINITY_DN5808_c0_g1_i1.p1 TRINITY_DN5808_c0_g1~~TRINITY_DN5808_c0_g1_i1.p1  ORF type:complete len:381 (-),score=58.31 TRINITY_DN5808_c0_g1_i1:141-1283(-)
MFPGLLFVLLVSWGANAYPRSLLQTPAFAKGLRCPFLEKKNAVQQQTQHPAPEPLGVPPPPLELMNHMLQDAYGNERNIAVDQLLNRVDRAVVHSSGSTLTLLHPLLPTSLVNNTGSSPQTYLKLVSHVVLGSFVITDTVSVAPHDPAVRAKTLATLTTYANLLAVSPASLNASGFTATQTERSERIINRTAAFLAAARATISRNATVSPASVHEFADAVMPDVSLHIEDWVNDAIHRLHAAASYQLDVLDRVAGGTDGHFPRDNIYVLVSGSHMARSSEMHTSYFAARFNDSATSGRRVVFCEGLADDACFALLGTHLNDHHVGEAFFSNPNRMHVDLLADASTRAIERLFPGPRSPAMNAPLGPYVHWQEPAPVPPVL